MLGHRCELPSWLSYSFGSWQAPSRPLSPWVRKNLTTGISQDCSCWEPCLSSSPCPSAQR